MSDLHINLPIFEGPLDLLLYLIRRDELDIWDIPISHITDEYLRYIETLQELNLDLAGDFLVMAATLTQIKSRMLLPTLLSDEGEEEIDPRQALVERLLVYERFRKAAESLEEGTILGRDIFNRAQEAADLEGPLEGLLWQTSSCGTWWRRSRGPSIGPGFGDTSTMWTLSASRWSIASTGYTTCC